MTTTAQVQLSSKTENISSTQLIFGADYADGRNKEWAAATPALTVNMTVKPEVAAQFKVGGHYTLTFTEQES